MKKRQLIHGEVNFFECEKNMKLPADAIEIKFPENYYVVGESETHGNDHRVAVEDHQQIKFYESASTGKLYMINKKETNVYCPKQDRHDTITLPASVWEIDKAKEYDYVEEALRNVRD